MTRGLSSITGCRRLFLCVALFFISTLLTACGKRGAPLPPLPQIPAPPPQWGILIAPDHPLVWFQPPDRNVDGSRPARIEWIYLFDTQTEPTDWHRARDTWRRTDVLSHPRANLRFLPWTPQPGCYVLVLANHKRKWSSPAPKRCLPEKLPHIPPPKTNFALTPDGIRWSGPPQPADIRIDRLTITTETLPATTDDPTAWPWAPYHRIEKPTTAWMWTDDRITEKVRYLYLVRLALEPEEGVRILGPGKIFGPIEYVDRFPPPVPEKLTAVLKPEGVELTWVPIFAPDLKGYTLYARFAGTATWHSLTDKPVEISRYLLPLRRIKNRLSISAYPVTVEFQVRSIDRHDPPNESPSGPTASLTLPSPLPQSRPSNE